MKINVIVSKGMNVSCAIIDSQAYILLEDKKEVLSLDEVGSHIWQLINGSNSVDTIIQECLLEFDADSEQVSEDVTAFLKILNEEGLVVFTEFPCMEVVRDDE